MTTPLESVLNLGPASSAWLAEVGIHTLADLKKVGAVAAYQMVKKNQKQVSLNLLYALSRSLNWNAPRTAISFASRLVPKNQHGE